MADPGRPGGVRRPAGARVVRRSRSLRSARSPSSRRSSAGRLPRFRILGSAVIATTALLSVLDSADTGSLLGVLAAGTTNGRAGGAVRDRCRAAGPRQVSGSARRLPTMTAGRLPAVRVGGWRWPTRFLPTCCLFPWPMACRTGCMWCQAADAGVTLAPVTSLDMTRQLADLTLDRRARAQGRVAERGVGAERAVGLAALQAGRGDTGRLELLRAGRAGAGNYPGLRRSSGTSSPGRSARSRRSSYLARRPGGWRSPRPGRHPGTPLAPPGGRHDPDAPVAVALAKAACSDTALQAGQEMVQMHGGIGFTWEHPAHLYLKRAKSTARSDSAARTGIAARWPGWSTCRPAGADR